LKLTAVRRASQNIFESLKELSPIKIIPINLSPICRKSERIKERLDIGNTMIVLRIFIVLY